MSGAIDYNAINWVRLELVETLKQARQALEGYAQNPDDGHSLRDCQTGLHQVGGSLQMVELRDAGLLAAEMEALVEALAGDRVQQPEAAMEQLLQAFYRLPEYLARIGSGRPAPAELLPLVNGLRAQRGTDPVPEAAGFDPDLTMPVPVSAFDPQAAHGLPELREVARKSRRSFQAGLLEWYRSADSAGLQQMCDALVALQRSSRLEPAARLWWLSVGVAEALLDSGLRASAETTRLFGQIDRQIKQLIDADEAVFAEAIPQALLKALLLQLAHTSGDSGRVGEIRDTYGLPHCGQQAADEGVSACGEELLGSVAGVALEELARFRERLDGSTSSGMDNAADLDAVATGLHGLANSLDMAGLASTGRTLAACEQRLREMANGASAGTESAMQEIADSIITVEAALKDVRVGDSGPLRQDQAEDSAYREGLATVMQEAVTDMVQCRNAIDDYLKSPQEPEQLKGVPGLLSQVRGGLQLIGQERAALMVAQVSEYIEHALMGGEQLPDEWQLDTLAEAFCSVEYHVAELGENRDHGDMVLDIAEQSLHRLGRRDSESPDAGAGAPPQGQQGAGLPVISALQVHDDDLDSEILDIFIEEVEGEMQRLAELLPRWLGDQDNGEILEAIRRSFHTLKGGGRMVGALALGEFSAVFESLLNQVSAGVVEPDDRLREFVMQSLEPLAQLFAQLRGGPAVDAAVDAMAAQAVRLADPAAREAGMRLETASGADAATGSEPGQGKGQSAAAAVLTAPLAEQEAAQSVAGLPVLAEDADPEIVEVFQEEAAEVLAVIVEQLPEWTANVENSEALATVRRCFHTLKGSGRMAGAMLVGEFSWAFENMLNRVIDGTTPVTDELVALLMRVPDALAELVNQVSGGPPPEADYQALMTAAGDLAQGESAAPGMPVIPGSQDSASPEAPAAQTGAGEVSLAEGDPVLLEIFTRECQGHLDSIRACLANYDTTPGACAVSEALYRALHTLSGISESAQATPVQALAGDLYAYVARLYEAQQPVDSAVLDVLRACTQAIGEMVEHLPELSFDADRQRLLQERIAGLPPVPGPAAVQRQSAAGERTSGVEAREAMPAKEPVPPAGQAPVVAGQAASVTGAGADADPDPYADLDPELLEVFMEEAGEIIENSEATLHAWAGEPGNTERLKEFQRQLHTLKGGARMADIEAIGDLSHSLETLVTRVAEGQTGTTPALFELLHEAHDRLMDMLEQVRARRLPAAASALEQSLDRFAVAPPAAASETGMVPDQVVSEPESGSGTAAREPDALPEPESQTQEPADASAAPQVPPAGESPARPLTDPLEQMVARTSLPDEPRQGGAPAQAERRGVTRVRGEQVRVQADLLDRLVNSAGEISIYRSRLEQQAGVYRFNLAEFDQTISRLREQLRQFEIETETQIFHRYGQETEDRNRDFDPLEMDRYSNLQQLSRLLLESINDLNSIQQMLDTATREFESLLLQQSRVSTDLQEGLMRTRMIPFAGLAPRLRRIVRQAAQELDKQVELGIEGADGEMDRTVIDRIIAPLEHMLRNAVDHGIEPAAQRRQAGKPEAGSITISFHREGPEIVLRIADDGRGVDVDAIRDLACERGLIAARDDLHDSEVMQFILQAGFSTASQVTQISGRGVGMDVVISEVKQLGGSLHIDSTPGGGSIFTIRLPYTLAINQALLVKACDDTYCIPLGNIEGVIRVDPAELSGCLQAPEAVYEYAGHAYKLQHLGTLLNRGCMDPEGMPVRVPVLLVRIGDKRVAIIVEALFGHREIVVKPLGAQLSHIDGVSGATILGDGRVVLILDLAAVVRMGNRTREPAGEHRNEVNARLVIMVVDDSITVRKVTARLLQKYGFDVVTARDGVDALGLLQETVPDMMLLDIEMPRMDGFELATLMRNDERLRHIPITMITSRTGDKHRERANQIGVDHYLGKPYQEHELLSTIHRLIGLPDSAPGVAVP